MVLTTLYGRILLNLVQVGALLSRKSSLALRENAFTLLEVRCRNVKWR